MALSKEILNRVRNLRTCANVFPSRNMTSSPLSPNPDPVLENMRLRQQLALSYRLLNDMSLNEATCNHLTTMAPRRDGKGEIMLLVPGFLENGGGIDWGEVTASCLLGLDKDGSVVEGDAEPEVSAASIHLGLRKSRPDARVVMHTHTPYATALGCLQDPTLLMVHQNSCRFLNNVAYDTGYQPAVEQDEGERLGNVLGDKNVLIMCHHGSLIVAESVAVALDSVYYLERACMVQLLAMGAGGREALNILPPHVQEHTRAVANDGGALQKYANKHFFSHWNKYKNINSDVFY